MGYREQMLCFAQENCSFLILNENVAQDFLVFSLSKIIEINSAILFKTGKNISFPAKYKKK